MGRSAATRRWHATGAGRPWRDAIALCSSACTWGWLPAWRRQQSLPILLQLRSLGIQRHLPACLCRCGEGGGSCCGERLWLVCSFGSEWVGTAATTATAAAAAWSTGGVWCPHGLAATRGSWCEATGRALARSASAPHAHPALQRAARRAVLPASFSCLSRCPPVSSRAPTRM